MPGAVDARVWPRAGTSGRARRLNLANVLQKDLKMMRH
jgi:hypothetical protein